MPRRRLAADVVHVQRVSRCLKIRRHARAHDAEPDESNLHVLVSSREVWGVRILARGHEAVHRARCRRGAYHGPVPISSSLRRAAFRPWMLVGSVWVILAIASGLYFSFPVFFVALFEEFGWSRGATALAFSISSVTQGVLSPVVGALVDRFGPRRVMLLGAFVLGAACLLGSRVHSLWSLYLITGVLAAVGACALSWVPSGALIARWFHERRGSMMGIAFSGMGAGVLVMGPLTQWLIGTYGWRAAYLVLGAGTLATTVPIVWFGIRDDAPAASAPRRAATRPARGETPPPARGETTSEVGAALRPSPPPARGETTSEVGAALRPSPPPALGETTSEVGAALRPSPPLA